MFGGRSKKSEGRAGEWWLAVDYGTTFTTAAIRAGGQRPEVLDIEDGRHFPSLVCLGEDGALLTGRDAATRAEVFPEHVDRVPKRSLIDSDHVRIGGRTVAVVDLVAAVLRRVKAAAQQRQGGSQPSRLVMTHPVRWGTRELAFLTQAAQKAELPAPIFVPEPVAAARYFLDKKKFPLGSHVAVYDFGGGTLDTAVLKRTPDGFQIVGDAGGDQRLGGEDLDQVLYQWIERTAAQLQPDAWTRLQARAGRAGAMARARWRRRITQAREELSRLPVVSIREAEFEEEGIRVDVATYQGMTEEILIRSVDLLLATVDQAGLRPQSLAAVFLTGGASRTPRVYELIQQRLGIKAEAIEDPKIAVVLGALVEEPRVSQQSDRSTTVPPAAVPQIHQMRPQPPANAYTEGSFVPAHVLRVGKVDQVVCAEGRKHLFAVTLTGTTARLWDINERRHVADLHEQRSPQPVQAVACTMLGSVPIAVTLTQEPESTTLRLWELETGAMLDVLRDDSAVPAPFLACAQVDGRSVAVTRGESTLRIWDLEQHTLAFANPLPADAVRGFHRVLVARAAGREVAVTWDLPASGKSARLIVWDLSETYTIDEHNYPVPASRPKRAKREDPASARVSETPARVAVIAGDPERVMALAEDGKQAVWELTADGQQEPYPGAEAAADAESALVGGRIATVSGVGETTASVRDFASGHAMATLTGHPSGITLIACAWLRGAPFAVTAWGDGSLRLWNLDRIPGRELRAGRDLHRRQRRAAAREARMEATFQHGSTGYRNGTQALNSWLIAAAYLLPLLGGALFGLVYHYMAGTTYHWGNGWLRVVWWILTPIAIAAAFGGFATLADDLVRYRHQLPNWLYFRSWTSTQLVGVAGATALLVLAGGAVLGVLVLPDLGLGGLGRALAGRW